MTAPSQVGWSIVAAMLLSNDVFQMKRIELIVFMDAAILASARRSPPDRVARTEIY
jgi:hypothetical protein